MSDTITTSNDLIYSTTAGTISSITTNGTPTYTIIQQPQEDHNMMQCVPVDTYAYSGLNFLLICAGIAAVIAAGSLAYNVYKSHT